jgi:hypothetical protein
MHLEPQGQGFETLWCLKLVLFFLLSFYIINFVKPNITFWFYLIAQLEYVERAYGDSVF